MSQFLTDLIVREIDDEVWDVQIPFDYQSDFLKAVIEVPPHFRTDFASIPRIPFIFDVLGDIAHEAAVIHDWLYYSGLYSRAMADKVLLEAMEVTGVSLWKRWQIYTGVRLGGWVAWNAHRKAGHGKSPLD